ncbi:MAG: HIT family protein [Acidimicrobiales bacterium]
MPTLFTRIISGEIPGRFVWRDERCVGFLSINPLRPGHTLVVPIEEIDHWLDCPADLLHHLIDVGQTIGTALDRAYQPAKVGLTLAGLEVPHVHFHVVPIWHVSDLDFARAERDPAPAALDEAAETVRAALRAVGHSPPDA